MPEGIALYSARKYLIWMTAYKDLLWQLQSNDLYHPQQNPDLLLEIVEFISILPNVIWSHFMYLNTSSTQNVVLPSTGN